MGGNGICEVDEYPKVRQNEEGVRIYSLDWPLKKGGVGKGLRRNE